MFSSERNRFKLGLRAQFTLTSLVMVLIMLIVLVKLWPVMEPYISDLVTDMTGDYAMAAVVMGLVPFFIALAIIMSVLYYIFPRRD